MPPLAPDQLDPDWHKYPETILHFRTEPPVLVDLRQPVGEGDLNNLRMIGLDAPFAVLTAQDPRGRDEDPVVNDRRAQLLSERLVANNSRFVHVDACSPDGSHCEASVAVLLRRDAAVALAAEFEQVAIFWFDGEKFWIVGVLATADPVMLPRAV